MPFRANTDYDGLWVEMGHGDILIGLTEKEDLSEATFLTFTWLDRRLPINEPVPDAEGRPTHEFGPSVHIQFTTVEQLDHTIRLLNQARSILLGDAEAA